MLRSLWWIFGVTTSLCCCGRLIYGTYMNWYEKPVIISISESSTQVWEIPFPAVTICPTQKVDLTKFNITDAFDRMNEPDITPHRFNNYFTDEEEELFEAVLHICDSLFLSEMATLGENTTADGSITNLLMEVAPRNIMSFCKFNKIRTSCDRLFSEIMTEEGLYYTFNMLNGKELYNHNISPDFLHNSFEQRSSVEWSPYAERDESKYIDMIASAYPRRAISSGVNRYELSVELNLDISNREVRCNGFVDGFKIVLHNAGEMPQFKYFIEIPSLHQISASVRPTMITTSDELKALDPIRRGCYFNGERRLRFLKVYTQRNCELECLFNYTLKQCGCVQFYMPRHSNISVCGSAQIYCYREARDYLLIIQMNERYSARRVQGCNCLPACNSITYDADISKNPIENTNIKEDGRRETILSIAFKEDEFVSSTRSERFGIIDFLSNCGGLLGLFLGASFLSIVEFLYFWSFRLLFTMRSRKSRKWKTLPKITKDAINNRKRKRRIIPRVVVVKPVSGLLRQRF